MNSDFYNAYKRIIRKLINSDGIEKLSCKERKKILKLLNNNPLVDTPIKPSEKINPFELYYTLYLPEYTDAISKRKATSVSFKYFLDSNQSQAAAVGHYNAMSVRTLSNFDGTQRIKNMYIMFCGFRSPADPDSNDKDNNGKIIQRDLRRMYLETFEITRVDDNGVSIGGMSGQLHYRDEGSGTATSAPKLVFPISHAYGIWENYKNGYIDWNYENSGLYLRRLVVNPPGNQAKAWAALSSETALVVAGYETIMGSTEHTLDGSRENVRTGETNLGRLIADSTLWFAQKYAVNNSIGFSVDIALKHAGGILKNISGPTINRLDIGSALIYNDVLVISQLNANQLVATIENSLSRHPSADGRFLQVAGVSIEFGTENPGIEGASTLDKPSRITNMSVTRANGSIDKVVVDGSIQGDVGRLFGIAFNNYMLVGGDGYSSFVEESSNNANARKVFRTKIGEQIILEKYIIEELRGKVDLPIILNNSRIVRK